MSCINITACQLACSPSAFPSQAFQLRKTSICPSTYLGISFPKASLKLPKASLKLISAAPTRQQAAIVCLFGGKGNSGNDNEASPWKALKKAAGSFKKNPSIEDVLKQQIQKQEYFDDGGTGSKRPGGGGSGGGGDGEGEDEGLSGMWDEFAQVILATIGFVFLYMYIINGEEITVIARDFLRFVFTRQKSIRLRRLMNQWKLFFQRMKEKQEYDPYWLEREILNTPTWYDHPAKYRLIGEALQSRSNDAADAADDDDDNDDADDE